MKISNLILFCLLSVLGWSQNTISLKQCQELAFQNSISLKNLENNVYKNQLNYKFSKKYWHPSISIFGTYNINFGRRVDPFTNTFSTAIVHSNSYGGSINMNLFSGLRNRRQVQMNQLNYLIEKDKVSENKIAVKRQVTDSYFSILEKQVSIEISTLKLNEINQQLNRNVALQKMGRSSKLDSLILSNQKNNELNNLNNIKQQLQIEIINLNSIMNRVMEDTIVAEIPSIDSTKIIPLDFYDDLSFYKIKQLDKQIKSSEIQIKKAKGAYSPNISLSGSVGTGFSTNNLDFSVNPSTLIPYGKQIEQNLYESVGLSISFPIYSRGTNKQEVEFAKIEIENVKNLKERELIKQEQQEKTIKTQISYLFRNQELTKEQIKRNLEIFNLTKELFEKGRLNQLEFELARNKYFQSILNLKIIQLAMSKIFILYGKS